VIVPALIGGNVLILLAEILATLVLFVGWAWFGTAPWTDFALFGMGLLLAVIHPIFLSRLANAKLGTAAKISALLLVPLPSLAVVALVFLGPR
jgi:hypothetical protein